MVKFGFIVHPLTIKDLTKKFSFAEKISDKIVKKAIQMFPPIKVAEVEGVKSRYGETGGCFVAVTLLPEQMLQLPLNFVEKKIVKACRVAEGMGAQIIGLGAFTSVVGDKGISIAKQLRTPITTGNTYTVATALEAVKEACKILGKDLNKSEIVIIGANGSIGRACAKILAREAKYLSLVSRNLEKLEQLAQEILMETGLSVHISNQTRGTLKRADVVISVSSSIDTIIYPEHLKTGAIVCDVARPRDVSASVSEKRKDVLVIEGGLVKVPGYAELKFDFGLPPGTCYACMAETMILALEGRCENYSIGNNLEIDKVYEITKLAKKHGFELAGFRGFNRTLDFSDVKKMKETISRNVI
jgi:predicted amino acid dehydrogenase